MCKKLLSQQSILDGLVKLSGECTEDRKCLGVHLCIILIFRVPLKF